MPPRFRLAGAHASLRDACSERGGKRLPPERWTNALAGVNAAVVVAGHTHQQDDRVVGSVRFINAGSVGLPYEGDGAARWLWVADGVPQLHHTAYDAARAGARILATGWPDKRSVGAALVEPIEAIVVTRISKAAPASASPAVRRAFPDRTAPPQNS